MSTRANIHLDAEAYNFASAYARARGLALGAAVSELLRKAEQIPEQPVESSSKLERTARGYLVKARTGRVITPEMVKQSSEDDLA